MKKSHIIAIIFIAVAIGAILTTLTDSSTYANFAEAFNSPQLEYHVVGTLDRDGEMSYNPEKNPDLFAFQMTDREGMTKQVYLHKPKPQDFERSEQIVLIGKASEDGAFHAKDILMKCPSKYNDGSESDFRTEDEMRGLREKEMQEGSI